MIENYPPSGPNDRDLARMMERVAASVDLDARLPRDPFRRGGALDICQFDWILSGQFARVFAELATAHGDDEVSFVVLDPDPDTYYRTHYGTCPAFTSMAAELSVPEYWSAISWEPGGDPTGAIAYTANVITAVGSSQDWAVFADRRWDLTLVTSPARSRPWRSVGIPFVRALEALASFTEPEFKTPLLDAERATFVAMVRQHGEAH